MIGYITAHNILPGRFVQVLLVIALALHFLGVNHTLWIHYRERFDSMGRWIFAGQRCGAVRGERGIAWLFAQRRGRSLQGFNVDFCRAVAAAALGNPDKVVFTPVSTANRLPILLSGKIDLLMRDTTYTFEREAALGVHFAGIYFYDGGAFMVSRRSGVRNIAELNGATICVGKRTTHETNLEDYFSQRGWTYKPLPLETLPEMMAAFFGGQCQALCSDRSRVSRHPA